MTDTVTFRVSASGQLSLPANVRRRWGMAKGGRVEVVDLGRVVLVAPEGSTGGLLDDLLPRAEHHAFVDRLPDDDDLTTT